MNTEASLTWSWDVGLVFPVLHGHKKDPSSNHPYSQYWDDKRFALVLWIKVISSGQKIFLESVGHILNGLQRSQQWSLGGSACQDTERHAALQGRAWIPEISMGFKPTLNCCWLAVCNCQGNLCHFVPWTCTTVDLWAVLKILALGNYHPSTIILGFPKTGPWVCLQPRLSIMTTLFQPCTDEQEPSSPTSPQLQHTWIAPTPSFHTSVISCQVSAGDDWILSKLAQVLPQLQHSTHFQPLLDHTSCSCHIASSAAQGRLWSNPIMVARKPGLDCSHSAASNPWRGCHVALVCQLHCLLTCNHEELQPASTSPALQVSKSLPQGAIMYAKIQKIEICHTSSSWIAPFLSHGFKEWDRALSNMV